MTTAKINPQGSLGEGPVLPVIGLYQYDEALRDYLTLDVFPDPNDPQEGDKITVIPVTGPPRAEYGTQDKLHETLPQDEYTANHTLRLPVMSLSRLDFTFKPERWTKARFRKLAYTEEGNRVVQSAEPMPFDIMYQLDVYTKYRVQMNQMLRKLALKFLAREVWLPVNLGGTWGPKSIPVKWMEGPKDLTLLDHGSHGSVERKIRSVITLIMQAWIMPDLETIPTVRKTTYTYYLKETGSDWPTSNTDTIDLTTFTEIKKITLDSTIGEDPTSENP